MFAFKLFAAEVQSDLIPVALKFRDKSIILHTVKFCREVRIEAAKVHLGLAGYCGNLEYMQLLRVALSVQVATRHAAVDDSTLVCQGAHVQRRFLAG
jgi:hypothetical protein